MEIHEVKVRLGATIEMGEDENLRPEIEITAGVTDFELKTGKLVELLENAQKDLAVSLLDIATQDLKTMRVHEIDEAERWATARDYSRAFDWIAKLHRTAALDLLTEVVGDLKQADKAKASEGIKKSRED